MFDGWENILTLKPVRVCFLICYCLSYQNQAPVGLRLEITIAESEHKGGKVLALGAEASPWSGYRRVNHVVCCSGFLSLDATVSLLGAWGLSLGTRDVPKSLFVTTSMECGFVSHTQ